ncbi:protein kinase domain-containing protein [Streptomyces lunaelactis]|uniref:serine/threonine-protein kinase n=1 Tax=Streptomyces lunaelactis TaxID=1535768 RepID=UPI00158482A3|nr:serine/threonine-protein kinase [Streptomyces lunaelactis]NUK05305.1 PQQ-binding-like beta-propeller repeat protein [Streptomyces lunaelactis]NUK17012.1 PQQ-binding-like beta-propeller repeat protein [Streptomyces lunaelactis]
MLNPLTHDDPAQLGAYRLIARLGSGGMGTVYLARSAGGRTVALKTMHAGIASDPAFRTRFRLETDAARIIGGHHGATVVDADPLAETPWLATEYVLGPPLDDAVAISGPLPEPTVRALGAALAGALAQLHTSDVVHRDLKPSNVMVTAYGPKIIDFGIARAAGDDRLTRTGAAAGTPAFMSPEQATGQEHTPAGDVFALAGVLVFAASGHGPFGSGQPADLLYRVRYAEPDLTGVPGDLAPILLRCLAKDPTQRSSTRELASHLHDGQGHFADHLPDLLLVDIARRATAVWQHQPYRLPTPAEAAPAAADPVTRALARRKLLTLGGGSALGVAAAGLGAWAWLGSRHASSGSGGKPRPSSAAHGPGKPKAKLRDYLWQVQIPPLDDITYRVYPAADPFPVALGDHVMLVIGTGLAAVDPKTGKGVWTTTDGEGTWRVATEDKQIFRIADHEFFPLTGGVKPLVVDSVDAATGKAAKPRQTFPDFNVLLMEGQLICCADDVLYLVGGTGGYVRTGYKSGQSWFLVAVDMRSGAELWRRRLPPHKTDTRSPHFLAGRVVGNRLVLLQETAAEAVTLAVHDSRTGKPLWSAPATNAAPDLVRGLLTVDDRHVYLGFGPLRALRLTDGKEEWSLAQSHPDTAFGPPAVKDDVVYAVQDKQGLVAVGAADGRVRWQEKRGEGAKADRTDPPVIGTKYVYSKGPSALRQIDISTHTTTATYKTSGTRFIAHERARIVFAQGGPLIAGYPLE